VQLGRHGITVNCIHPGTTRTERTPRLLAARAKELGVTPEEAEQRDFSPDSPRGNAICRMVDAAEIAYLTVFLASDKAWAVSGVLVVATGGAGQVFAETTNPPVATLADVARGEFLVRGWMEQISSDHPAAIEIARRTRTPLAFYALSVEEAVGTIYEGADRDPVYRRWRSS